MSCILSKYSSWSFFRGFTLILIDILSVAQITVVFIYLCIHFTFDCARARARGAVGIHEASHRTRTDRSLVISVSSSVAHVLHV